MHQSEQDFIGLRLPGVRTQHYITPSQRHKLSKSLCRRSQIYNYTFPEQMAGGSQDFTELRQRSSQIKERLECLGLLKNRMHAERKGNRHDNKRTDVATGLLLV